MYVHNKQMELANALLVSSCEWLSDANAEAAREATIIDPVASAGCSCPQETRARAHWEGGGGWGLVVRC